MSGGVDSSVAAALLVEQGYDVIGATMRLFCYSDREVADRPCCSLDSIADAQAVAATLGIPHYTLNLADRFGRDVIGDFVAEYSRGRTPIPCVRCNSFTKFRDLLTHADALECDHIATGHYAIAREGRLYRGRDLNKDQSYFLWGLDHRVIARMLTPVGEQTKDETRAVARKLGLITADKAESVEICFVPDGDYVKVLQENLPADAPALAPGPVVTTAGQVVGEHAGFARYTIGQRRRVPALGEPMYVVSIQPETRAVVVGTADELYGNRVELDEVNWLGAPLAVGDTCGIQIRYRTRAVSARISTISGSSLALELAEPVRAITPGQSGVLYDGERLLGGGLITLSPVPSPLRGEGELTTLPTRTCFDRASSQSRGRVATRAMFGRVLSQGNAGLRN
jgi:tRNA-specific 2-thiouridylase